MPDNLAQLKAEYEAALHEWAHGYDDEKFSAWDEYRAARDIWRSWDKFWGSVSRETWLQKHDELREIASQKHEAVYAVEEKINQAWARYKAIEEKYKQAKAEAERAEIYNKVMALTGGR